jgi:phospholipase C
MPKTVPRMKTIQIACLAIIALADYSFGQEILQNSQQRFQTAYPIEHLVIIFQENISFDHYFATYPVTANPPREPRFVAKPGTPSVNGLTQDLLTRNQNSLQPQRLDRSHAATADQNHNYPNEQEVMDHGLMETSLSSTQGPLNRTAVGPS